MNRELPRTLLILGRVSNLPTVWSNCLAAWMLTPRSGVTAWPLFSLVAGGVTALYLGGMYLNDAFDVAFDTLHRPERPIPSRKISRRAVAIWGGAWLAAGVLLLVPVSGAWAGALAGAILLYNAIHKHTPLGLPVMAGCRALIYPLAGVAAAGAAWPMLPGRLWAAAGCMALWVLVLSILARTNSRYSAPVPNLLAAIPLVDLLLVFPHSLLDTLPFLGFTALALYLRRSIPPT
ncbi:MAG: UbiA family prenyltransferase [Chthoniobacteraceae bacterium]|nr:UbiA family prenyltransferase [Chthoniobacteraceae bacterium]